MPLILAIGRGGTATRWVEVTDTAMLELAITEMRRKSKAVTRP